MSPFRSSGLEDAPAKPAATGTVLGLCLAVLFTVGDAMLYADSGNGLALVGIGFGIVGIVGCALGLGIWSTLP